MADLYRVEQELGIVNKTSSSAEKIAHVNGGFIGWLEQYSNEQNC